MKYTPAGGRIAVKIAEEEKDGKKYAVITVEDNGVGIPEELQKRVFDSFITGDYEPAYSTKVAIGLRIVKNTMDLHHGVIRLDSHSGQGTKFTLYVPEGKEHFKEDRYTMEQAASTAGFAPAFRKINRPDEKEGKLSGKTILIIDDNEEVRKYIRSLFCKTFCVLEAENGETGIKTATEQLPDLIISDIMMPVKNGFTCCKEIKQQPQTAHIPIILLTAKIEEINVLQGINLGADAYIMKPFNPEILKAKAENLIRMRTELKRIYTKTLMLKQQEPASATTEDELFMQRIINIVEIHLTDPDFSVIKLASLLNLSQPTLYRKIKNHTGLSVIELIRSIRIGKAAALILQKKYYVLEVAEMVGYNDLSTFRKHFTNQFGVPPSKYV